MRRCKTLHCLTVTKNENSWICFLNTKTEKNHFLHLAQDQHFLVLLTNFQIRLFLLNNFIEKFVATESKVKKVMQILRLFVTLDVWYSRNHERERKSCSFNDCLD